MRYLRTLMLASFCIGAFQSEAKWSQVELPTITVDQTTTKSKKSWTFIVYIAADNDLFEFAFRDLKEMAKVGSNDQINIIAQLDGYGMHEKTKRLYVDKDVVYQIEDSVSDEKLDSGSDKTLVDCFKWAMENYPADHYALVLWNHGSGILDPTRGHPFKASQLFKRNPLTNMLEIDRSIGFMEIIQKRGICFSDTYGTYLTNEKLESALSEIVSLRRKKLDLIAFDACLMAMVEIMDITRYYADYMVASEEVEPGDGWWYHEVLAPLKDGYVSPFELARHAVEGYRIGYLLETREFTQSAIQLRRSHGLIDNINRMSTILLQAIDLQLEGTLDLAVEVSKDRRFCTCFAEPSYIDLHHFYSNLRLTLPFVKLQEGHSALLDQLDRTLEAGIKMLETVVIANVSGADLPRARGLSIYFPDNLIDTTYEKTYFARENAWIEVLKYFTR